MHARIISYVPSITRRERLNVGVIVVNGETVHAKVVDQVERLRHLDPAFDQMHIQARLKSLVHDARDLSCLAQVMARIDPTFEFSDPIHPTSPLSAAEMAEALFRRMVQFQAVAPEASVPRARPKNHEQKGNNFLRQTLKAIRPHGGKERPWKRNVPLDRSAVDLYFGVSEPPPSPRPLKMSLCVPNCSKVMVIEPLVKDWIDGSEAFSTAALFDYIHLVLEPHTQKVIDKVVLLLDAGEDVDAKMVDLASRLCEEHSGRIVQASEKSQLDWLHSRLREYWDPAPRLLSSDTSTS